MKKISENDLSWALSHKDEKVWRPVFEFWLRQWLFDSAPAGKETIEAWRQNEKLLKQISPAKIEQRFKETLFKVLGEDSLKVAADKVPLNYQRFDVLLDCTEDSDCILQCLLLAIQRLAVEMKKYPKFKREFDLYVKIFDMEINNQNLYLLVPAAMKVPEVYDVLEKQIFEASDLQDSGFLVSDLLKKAFLYRDKTYKLLQLALTVTRKSGDDFFENLLLLHGFNNLNSNYSGKLKDECLDMIADRGSLSKKDWRELLEFATSDLKDEAACYFGVDWRLSVCDILLDSVNPEDDKQIQEFLCGIKKLTAMSHQLGMSEKYIALFRKIEGRFPAYRPELLDLVDNGISHYAQEYIKVRSHVSGDVWQLANVSYYRREIIDWIKFALKLSLRPETAADKRWRYTRMMMELMLYDTRVNVDDMGRKVEKMLAYRWEYGIHVHGMLKFLIYLVKSIGAKDDLKSQKIMSLVLPVLDKMLRNYKLNDSEQELMTELAALYMPRRPDYWQKCQACVEENLKKESDRQQKELEREAFRINRILKAISE